MLYAGHVKWFNDYDGDIQNCWFFVNANSYSHVMDRCVEHFGEDAMMEVTLEEFSPYDFLEFWDGGENVFNETKAVALEYASW